MPSAHDMMLPPTVTPEALIEQTWHEIGGSIRPLGYRIYVRTWEIPEKIGHIVIPDLLRSFYKGMPHSKLVRATVVAAPEGAPVKPGQYVCFPQTFFARYKYLTDGTILGYLDWRYLHGTLQMEGEDDAWIRAIREGSACPERRAEALGA